MGFFEPLPSFVNDCGMIIRNLKALRKCHTRHTRWTRVLCAYWIISDFVYLTGIQCAGDLSWAMEWRTITLSRRHPRYNSLIPLVIPLLSGTSWVWCIFSRIYLVRSPDNCLRFWLALWSLLHNTFLDSAVSSSKFSSSSRVLLNSQKWCSSIFESSIFF